MSNESHSRYLGFLRHAVAEITLVVIGILVAFQIDEWNTDRELRRKEVEYLSDIRINLLSDIDSLQTVIDFNTDKLARLQNMTILYGDSPTPEQLADQMQQNDPTISSFEIFIPNRVAFDNMVAAENIDLVVNRVLRNRLTEFYSQISPYQGTQQRVAEVTRKYSELALVAGMNSKFLQNSLNMDVEFPIRSLEEISPQSNIELLSVMFLLGAVTSTQQLELESLKDEVEILLESIDDELVIGAE